MFLSSFDLAPLGIGSSLRAILRERVTLLSVSACLTLTDDTLLGALRPSFHSSCHEFRSYTASERCNTVDAHISLGKNLQKRKVHPVRSSSFFFFFFGDEDG